MAAEGASLEMCTQTVASKVSHFYIPNTDGYELPSDGRQKVFANGSLIISSAAKDLDEGYYTCTAFNRKDESDSGSVHIQVMSMIIEYRYKGIWYKRMAPFSISAPPTIMPFLFPNNLLNEGMRSAVSCQILEGNLPISFGWFKNGDEVPMSSRRQQMDRFQVLIRSNDEYSSTLVIDRLQFSHRGNYTCRATNAAGSATHTAELIVNGMSIQSIGNNILCTHAFFFPSSPAEMGQRANGYPGC